MNFYATIGNIPGNINQYQKVTKFDEISLHIPLIRYDEIFKDGKIIVNCYNSGWMKDVLTIDGDNTLVSIGCMSDKCHMVLMNLSENLSEIHYPLIVEGTVTYVDVKKKMCTINATIWKKINNGEVHTATSTSIYRSQSSSNLISAPHKCPYCKEIIDNAASDGITMSPYYRHVLTCYCSPIADISGAMKIGIEKEFAQLPQDLQNAATARGMDLRQVGLLTRLYVEYHEANTWVKDDLSRLVDAVSYAVSETQIADHVSATEYIRNQGGESHDSSNKRLRVDDEGVREDDVEDITQGTGRIHIHDGESGDTDSVTVTLHKGLVGVE